MNSLLGNLRSRWQVIFEPENRPVLVIAVFGLLVSLCFVPALFSHLFALTPLGEGQTTNLWWFAGGLGLISMLVGFNRLSKKQELALLFFNLLLLISGELTVRLGLVWFAPSWRESVIAHGVVAYPEQWRFRAHPFLQYVGNDNALRFTWYNKTGFSGREVSREKAPNVIRIACLGGSTTETGYPAMMEDYLNNREKIGDIKFEVLNFGLSGYTSNHSTTNFVINVVDYSPDYVVFHHAKNDSRSQGDKDTLRPHNFRSDYTHILKSFTPPQYVDLPLIRTSVIYRELKNFINPYDGWSHFERTIHRQWPEEYLPPSEYPSPDNIQTYVRNVQTIIDVAQGREIQPVMATQPHSTDPQVIDFKHAWFIDLANEAMRDQVKREEGVVFVDLDQAVTGNRNDIFRDVVHMTDEGIQLKAEMIGDEIYNHVLTTESQATQTLSSLEQQ